MIIVPPENFTDTDLLSIDISDPSAYSNQIQPLLPQKLVFLNSLQALSSLLLICSYLIVLEILPLIFWNYNWAIIIVMIAMIDRGFICMVSFILCITMLWFLISKIILKEVKSCI